MAWLQLKISIKNTDVTTVSDLLTELGAVAVTMEDSADQPLYEPPPNATPLWDATTLTGLFDGADDMLGVMARLNQELSLQTMASAQLSPLADQEWTRAWLEHFQPMQFGQHLWICPSSLPIPDPQAVNILLDPGLAFGTGTHPTTALCLEWLDAHPPNDAIVIDYGCGSGILAIAAAKLGAKHVIAIDNDPQALTATQANCQRNKLADGLVSTYLPQQAPSCQAQFLLANILAEPLKTLAPTFCHLTANNADLVLSGLLCGQEKDIISCYSRDFSFDSPVNKDGWLRLTAKKR